MKEERNILGTVKRRKATWIVQIPSRNCLLRHVFKSKDRRKHRNEGEKRKKTLAATGRP
jgi:hypothetical protein